MTKIGMSGQRRPTSRTNAFPAWVDRWKAMSVTMASNSEYFSSTSIASAGCRVARTLHFGRASDNALSIISMRNSSASTNRRFPLRGTRALRGSGLTVSAPLQLASAAGLSTALLLRGVRRVTGELIQGVRDLARRERFGQEAARAEGDGLHGRAVAVQRRDHEDRGLRRDLPDAPDRAEAVQAWQREIHRHHLRALADEDVHRFFAVLGPEHVRDRSLVDRAKNGVAHHERIVHDEQLHERASGCSGSTI